ncbi:MAG TPA: hypothetical protein VF389_10495 [Woeseiaceae bacterium]
MALVHTSNEYQIPRGRIYWDPRDDDDALTGEESFGNCPSFNIAIETEKLPHFSSETGLREKDASRVVQIDRTATITCDNVSFDNLAKYLSGTVETVTQTADPVVEAALTVIPGRIYQLGRTDANPAGDRNIAALAITDDATTYTLGTDYAVDLVKGRLQILESGTIPAGAIEVSYTKPAKTWKRIKTGATSELRGAIRVVADNAGSSNRDYYMPVCTLKPTGDLPVIAEEAEYVAMEFELEVLTPANGAAIYLDDAPVAE